MNHKIYPDINTYKKTKTNILQKNGYNPWILQISGKSQDR